MKAGGEGAGDRWLVLIHQFPQEPGSLRVKIWRRLQRIGAVSIKSSMYALPMDEQAREDFEWVLRELVAGGADGAILEAQFINGRNDAQVRALFDGARNEDYANLADEIREFLESLPQERNKLEAAAREARRHLGKFAKKLSEIVAIDFFGANSRGAVEGLIAMLSDRVAQASGERKESTMSMETLPLSDMQGKVWVTRRSVHVDRIASAWLVRRWIDSEAEFKFTGEKYYKPSPGEVRFDMFDAEFTHEGDQCTFEVLLRRAGLEDPALKHIGEIIHDIDLKDGKYNHPETAGIALLLAGLSSGEWNDERRIERGGAMFEDLYRSIKGSKE